MKQSVYVFDFDGTLADLGTRSPYSYADTGEDDPITETIHLLNTIIPIYKIIILTGRKEKWRNITIEWLKKYVPEFDTTNLIMQESDPAEKNHIFKEKKLRELCNTYNIMGVFDDNPDIEAVCKRLGIRFYLCK